MIPRAAALGLSVLMTAGPLAAACPPTPQTAVEIYPTAAEVPENLLRFYVYFPRPMAPGGGLQDVRLLDARGVPVNGVFLPTTQELWSPDRTRLTLLLDPGRVKSGLAAHEAMGRALVPGVSYTLVVSGAAEDAAGCALGADIMHTFSVTDPDFEIPKPGAWSFSAPRIGSLDPVQVDLGSPHDHLSMAYRLRIMDADGTILPGRIALGPDEKSWLFTPRRPWEDATYELVVDERLEDLAGNRPGGLFDRPTSAAPVVWQARWPFAPEPVQD